MAENTPMNKQTGRLAGREVLLEYTRIGNIMRVSAMDVQSLTEVVVQCPAAAGEAVFKQNGLLRLSYVLKKKGIIV